MGGFDLPELEEISDQNHPHCSGQTYEYRPARDARTTNGVSDSGTLQLDSHHAGKPPLGNTFASRHLP
jgi:hypothetical protein